MPARRRSRQKALQILFLWDLRKLPIEDAIRTYAVQLSNAEAEEEKGEDILEVQPLEPFAEALARGTAAQFMELDALIAKRAENWRIERMPAVDRNILRMAIHEMKDQGTPPAVVIDEALELARRYSEEEAIPFINGVLDSVRKIILPDSVAASNP
jgi:N utilization substance protein B